ncbi:hypothetical protein FACS189431_7110 [Alphaproteobacteria bacterium]|nr:hypothetical protein FACS189431_7110 [Alphaproteobacteria bacterium]
MSAKDWFLSKAAGVRGYVQAKGLKKVFAISGVTVAGCAIAIVLLANFLPGYWYKDIITVGDVTFSHNDVDGYHNEIKKYLQDSPGATLAESSVIDGALDTRSTEDIAFDDMFKNAALKEQAKTCGIELNDADNNPAFDYDTYSFTLIRERNRAWQEKLYDCVIKQSIITAAVIPFDNLYFDSLDNSSASALYNEAKGSLETRIKPLFAAEASATDIGKAADIDLIADSSLSITDITPWDGIPITVTQVKCPAESDCFNSAPIAEQAAKHPDGLVDANEVYRRDIQQSGDWTGVMTGTNGVFAIYRLESVIGQYNTWDDFYGTMKQQYAYDQTVTPVLALISSFAKSIASIFTDFVYACNSMGAQFDVYDQYGGNVNSYSTTGGAANTTGSGDLNSAGCSIYLDTLMDRSGIGQDYYRQICAGSSDFETGDTNDCDTGPLNCVGTNRIGILGDNPLFTGASDYRFVAWGINDMGLATSGWMTSDESPDYYFRTNVDGVSTGFWHIQGWQGGPGAANEFVYSGIKLWMVVERKAFQPTVTSSASAPVLDISTSTPTISDTITAHTTGGTTWISGVTVRFDFDLYECTDRQAPTGDGNVANSITPTVPGDCTKVATTNANFAGNNAQQNISFIGDQADNGNITDDRFAYSSGKNYYIVSRMLKSSNASVANRLVDDWYSPFSATGEQVKTPFSPQVSSKVTSNYITAGTNFVDQITVNTTDTTAPVRNPSIQGNQDAGHTWLRDDNNEYVKVQACVQAYGPATGPYPTSTSLTNPIPSGLNAVGSPVCNLVSPALGSPAGTINFNIPTTNWTPGYYYFITTIDGSNPANAAVAQYLSDGTNSGTNFSYTSPFNPAAPQSEWGYIQFQPVARSMMEGNRYEVDKGTTGRGSDVGVVFDCDDNKQIIQAGDPSITDGTLIKDKLTCSEVTDHIYIGAADTRIISGDTVLGDTASQTSYIADTYWPKGSSAPNADYVPVTYEVKLYGPFADPEGRNPATPADALGKTVTTVPYSGGQWQAPFATQPVARTGLLQTGANGPNWSGFNTNTNDYYKVTFKQDATGGTTGALTSTALKLAPGFYVSVVEIVKDSQTTSTKDLVSSNFYSTWGDAYESLSIPLPVYVWSEKSINTPGGSVAIGDTVKDKIYIKGFNNTRLSDDGYGNMTQGPWQDAIGNNMHTHFFNAPNNTPSPNNYNGTSGYFGGDTNAKLKVTLFRYGSKPTSGNCKATDTGNIAGGPWELFAKDTDSTTAVETPAHTIIQPGYYVYYVTYEGDDRVYPFSSKCTDVNEQLRVSGDIGPGPELMTQIKPIKDKAPTVVDDVVTVAGHIDEPNSIVDLTLFRRAGTIVNIATDTKLCTVQFTVSSAGQYSTSAYLNPDGTVKPANSPAGAPNPNRCFAATGGHYYWIEDFLKPDGNTHYDGYPITTPSDGEEIDIEEEKPTIITEAQPEVGIGEPFSDKAHVTLPGIPGKEYLLYFTAYWANDCPNTALWTNKQSPITITSSGTYDSPAISATQPGYIYWVETIVDKDTGEEISGSCGTPGETTYVRPPGPGTPPPIPPSAGTIIRNVLVITATGALLGVAAWQLLRRNPQLLPGRK